MYSLFGIWNENFLKKTLLLKRALKYFIKIFQENSVVREQLQYEELFICYG